MKHLAVHLALFLMPAAGLLAADHDPAWAALAPSRTIAHVPRPGASDGENGAALVKATADLQPGDKLEIGAGTYSVERMWDLRVSGTAQAPVWIVAAKDARVIITRPDARQNVLNIGQGGPGRFLALRGIARSPAAATACGSANAAISGWTAAKSTIPTTRASPSMALWASR